MRLFDEEIYILPYEKSSDKKLIYAPIRGFVECINTYEAEMIEKSSQSSLEDLGENSWLGQWLQKLREVPYKDLDVLQKGFPELNIDFSSGCNLQCIYCYACRGEGSAEFQKKENINLIIDSYFNYLKGREDFNQYDTCSIVFSNDAEPTFAPDLLIHTVEMIKEKAKAYKLKAAFSMPTNGVFGRKIREFIIENFEGISLSFDGPEAVQNRQRPLRDGRPSYDIVYANAKALYKSGIKMGFNIVVTKHNLDYLKETVDYFDQHFPGSKIAFSPVNVTGRVLKEQNSLSVEQTAFQSKLMEAMTYAKKTTVKLRDKHMQNYHMPRRHYCASTARPNWNVSLKGEIYACMESKDQTMKIGEIDFNTKEVKLQHQCIWSLQDYTVDKMKECTECAAKYVCVGGCKVRGPLKIEECEAVRQKLIHFIHYTYEEEKLLKEAKSLFERG